MMINQTLKSHKSGCSGRPANNCLSPMTASLIAQLVKNLPTMQETWVRSWVGRIPGEGNSYPLQYSGLENSMDCIDRGVVKSQTQLSDFHFHGCTREEWALGSEGHLWWWYALGGCMVSLRI